MKKIIIFYWTAAGVIALLLIGVVGRDAMTFHEVMKGQYTTPWYSNSWFTSPYRNFRLVGYPSKKYWTTNQVKSEKWLVREVQHGDKAFWTILQRKPV